MPPQEIIDGPSSFLLETLETCIGSYDDLYDEVNCLNLNIFVPSQALNGCGNSSTSTGMEATPLPVLVWIYGGALRRGGNGVCLYGN
jgi:carboxylesterase type B